MVFGKQRLALLDNKGASADVRKVPARQILFEMLRSTIVVVTIAHLMGETTLMGWRQSVLQFGIWLSVFPVMILLGAVLWDKRPWQLSAIHGGDWIFKILITIIILSI
jgi:hypothetical protein